MGEWILPHVREEIAQIKKADEQKQEIYIQHQLQEKAVNYVILDAVLLGWDIDTAFKLSPIYASLFATRGADHNLDDVAPYLFPYVEDSEFGKWLKSKEKTGLRALYLCSDESLDRLRKHLRRFLRVKTESGKWLFFRFYDPNVLTTSFPYLTIEQRNYFFSNIKYIQYYDLLSKEVLSDFAIINKKSENIQSKSKFPVLILSNEQHRSIGLASFRRLSVLKLLNNNEVNQDAEYLKDFVSKKVEQAMAYNLKERGIVYDYILLNLKYKDIINNFEIEESAHKLLSDANLTQFEKIVKLKNLLKSN